jgi:hypothetical protein
MKKRAVTIWVVIGILLPLALAFPDAVATKGQGQAIVTIMPQNDGQSPSTIPRHDLQVTVNGKVSAVESWVPLRGRDSDLELVVLIDSSARTSLGLQLDAIASFIQNLPPYVEVAVGYMTAGRSVFIGPLSTDHVKVARDLRIPGGPAGANASPYFCLSDLAKHWPSSNQAARREAVMITNGVDNYYEHFDPQDIYVQTAIADSIRAGLVVYSIYWPDKGRMRNFNYQSFWGQSLLTEVTQATGGRSYWNGNAEPVSFIPYLDDIAVRLRNQYRLSFYSPLHGKPQIRRIAVKIIGPDVEFDAPERVLIANINGK